MTMRNGKAVRTSLGLTLAVVAILTSASSSLAQRPLGLDVSYWQGNISQEGWNAVHAAGWDFVIIRATHYSAPGETDAHGSPDPYFVNNITRARAAGMLAGAYSFVRNTIRDPITEADFFLTYAGPYITNGYLRPMLDLEDGTAVVGAANLSAWANAWLDRVQQQTGVEPTIYCNSNYAKNYLNSTLASRTLWLANWGQLNGDPQTMNPPAGATGVFTTWAFWQYSNQGNGTGVTVPGISARVDLDVFNGTAAELQSYVIGGGNLPPVISNVQATNVTNTTATITWTTNTASSSQVQYGLTASYGTSSLLDNTAVTSHSVALSGLTPNTLYHYRAISTNSYGTTNSSDYTFTTASPPAISNVAATNVTASGATITWTTNSAANSQARYGLTSSYGSQTTLDPANVTSHSVAISGLVPNTLYHYQTVSANAYGTAQSTDFTFTTAGPPVVSGVSVTGIGSSSATIIWTTDTSADSQVEYGPTSSYGSTTALNTTPVTSHSVALSGLAASTLYHFRVRSANAAGAAYSPDSSFTTTAVASEIVIDNTDPGWANTSPSGSWTTGTNAAVPKIGTNYLYYAGSGSTSSITRSCTWTPSIETPGLYDVYVYYQLGTNRNSAAPYTVFYNGGSITSIQNQYSTTANQAGWFLIGQDLPFAAGASGYVQLANNSTDTNLVSADAAKFVLKSQPVQPPAISQQPAAQSVCPGGTATFTATATGNGTLTYQWQKGGANLSDGGHYSGTSTTTLTVSTADSSDAAYYTCVVTNSGGSTASNQAALTIKAATSITQHPTAQNVCAGGTATFTVAGSGDGTLTYQWQKNSGNLSNGGHYAGVTTATLTVSGADAGDVANYSCVVTAGCGNATSNQAALSLKTATAITQQPVAQTVNAGSTATFTVAAGGDGSLTYQWQKDTANLTNGGHYSGVTTTTLLVSAADAADAGSYRCVVTAGCGTATSNAVALAVRAPTFVAADFDQDGDVDLGDFTFLQMCFNGPNRPPAQSNCAAADLDGDNDVDLADFSSLQTCFNGPSNPPACRG